MVFVADMDRGLRMEVLGQFCDRIGEDSGFSGEGGHGGRRFRTDYDRVCRERDKREYKIVQAEISYP